MQFIGQIQFWIIQALALLALAAEIFALVHAVRTRSDAFPAAGKQTKLFWVALLVLAALMGFTAIGPTGGLGLLSIIGIVIAGVYLADVRPAIDQLLGRSRR